MLIPNKPPVIRSFGRVQGRKLNVKQQELVNNLLPKLAISIEGIEDGTMQPTSFFKNFSPYKIFMEIGFGFGESVVERSKREPNVGFIASETHINGIAGLLKGIKDNNIQNVRVFNGDVRFLLEKLTDHSLDKVLILFPDPWPKARHHKRRLLNPDFLVLLHSKIKKGGEFIFASDHTKYVEVATENIMNSKLFNLEQLTKDQWEEPKDWVQTRYQMKALKQGRDSSFFRYLTV